MFPVLGLSILYYSFKIKTGYYLKILTPEIIKLLGSTKKKINNGENGKNMSHLQMTEVVLLHCNILSTMIIHMIQEFFMHFFPINRLRKC